MKKDLDYYLGLPYPIESYFGEHEVGDAYLVQYIDFDITEVNKYQFEN